MIFGIFSGVTSFVSGRKPKICQTNRSTNKQTCGGQGKQNQIVAVCWPMYSHHTTSTFLRSTPPPNLPSPPHPHWTGFLFVFIFISFERTARWGKRRWRETLFGCKVSGEINKAAGAVPFAQEFSRPVLRWILMKYVQGERTSSVKSTNLPPDFAG